MSQLIDTLVGMDPAGDGALALCVIMAAVLGVLTAVGFGLVRAPKQLRSDGAERLASTAADLNLLALWRLNRSLGKSAHPQPGESPPVESVRTAS
jgi:hypothetical protein